MRALAPLAMAACCLPLLSCTDGYSDGPSVERCAALSALAPRATRECRESEEARTFVQAVEPTIREDAGALLVRLELDGSSRVRGVCADGVPTRTEWKARRRVGARIAALMETEPGPACLAGKRLDLNRRAAKLAEIEQVERLCRDEVLVTRDSTSGYLTRRFLERNASECTARRATWVLVHDADSGASLLFAKPETPSPPKLHARDTASRCGRLEDFEAQVTCVQGEGWEPLE